MSTMKEKCDNECNTCPVNGQIYCALMFARDMHQALPGILERMDRIEAEMQNVQQTPEQPPVINPLRYSAMEPTPPEPSELED